MISSYKQLTGRYLKANKKRSLLTIIGILLSVALIATIGFFIVGMQQAQIEDIKNGYGSWHVSFSAPEEEIISKVVNNPKVLKSGMYQQGEQINIKKDLKLSPTIASGKALELLPMKIKEGRFPKEKNEVALEKWVLPYIGDNIKVGDNIKIQNREYTLTGILQDSVYTQSQKNGTMLLISDNIDRRKAALLAEVSPKTNLKNAVKELTSLTDKKITSINDKGQKIQIPSVVKNSLLIDMQGGGDRNSGLAQLYIPVGIIIGIVVVATIAVIYNAFQISVVERIKQFGLLRAIGTTPKQIRKIVLREATILTIIGIPLGILVGVAAICTIQYVFQVIGGDSVEWFKLSISPAVIIISIIVGVVSVYVSALIPAFLAGRISPLVAINSRTSIVKEKIKKKRFSIMGKIFKFEGALASKNIKRNRKRYRITVFSIVISVVLFITFKSFMDMTLNISDTLNESKNIHFLVQTNSSTFIDNNIIKNISTLNSIDKVYKVYKQYDFDQFIDKDKEIKAIKGIGSIYGRNTNINGQEKVLMNGSINVYDKAALQASKKYIQSGSIDIDKLNNENGVVVINKNQLLNDKTNKKYVGPIVGIKVGDEIELQYSGETSNTVTNNGQGITTRINPAQNKGKLNKVKVIAILKEDPFDFQGLQNGIKIITTEEMAKKLTGKNDIGVVALNIVTKNVKNEGASKAEIEKGIKSQPSLSLINYLDGNRKTKSTILMVKILVYGFIVVVSLIGSVNIINTLTTNIILRKKEFAALKAIGLTQKGLRKMIILEGLLYAIVGTIYGSIIACGLSYMIYSGMSGIREMIWPVPWDAMIIATIASLVISYLSVLSPLARINKENLIEAVREDY
ncbi:FtsX-like permease family protein [Clostridium pasteurianum]|uniref:ABC transporter permease n=1 Tax=Clostridium pasteurianum TaxID=1501 RepID=UPI002260BE7C|nr:FtsX-like permease family protein [Clostridium pasteurianum]UZW13570.1 FtsX-like permease family protein [Clostridium pasteurianum]